MFIFQSSNVESLVMVLKYFIQTLALPWLRFLTALSSVQIIFIQLQLVIVQNNILETFAKFDFWCWKKILETAYRNIQQWIIILI